MTLRLFLGHSPGIVDLVEMRELRVMKLAARPQCDRLGRVGGFWTVLVWPP